MPRFKRSRYVLFQLEDEASLDFSAFLSGEVRTSLGARLSVLSALTSSEQSLLAEELELLLRTSSRDWMTAEALGLEEGAGVRQLEELAKKGLLICDLEQEPFSGLRRREERLEKLGWHPQAASYHLMSRWQDEEIGLPSDLDEAEALKATNAGRYARLAAERGSPPSPFHRIDAQETFALSSEVEQGPFYDLLLRRATCRAFDIQHPLEQKDLATLLFYVFGYHGDAELSPGIRVLKKTSPSGGSMHPVEAYPLLLNVEGLEPGLYHYGVEDHQLELLRQLERPAAEDLADELTAGQGYPRTAHALFILTGRFDRNLWKYGSSRRTYSVVLMDVAHLSQTFYLVAAELGLGAFFTGAINAVNIEQHLGLDPVEEGAIAICGCGLELDGRLGLTVPFVPKNALE